MKKALLAFGMILMTTPAFAGGIVTKHSSSVQLTVDAARSTASRIGHGMSISGSNVSTTDGTTAGVVGNSVLMTSDGFTGSSSVVTASQATSGEAFSFSASYTQGDAIPTAAPTVGDVPNFGSITSYSAGTAGSLAGTVTSAGAVTVTAGGAGSSAIGQFVSEITVID
jgi:hypothetical protein